MPELRAPDRERIRRLSKEGFWIVLGQAAAVLGSLAGVRLLTELLAPAVYGELALGLTVAALVNQIVLGPLANGITRFYAPAQEQGDLGGYLSCDAALVSAATGVVLLIILLAVAGLLARRARTMDCHGRAALVFATLSGYNAILNGIQNAARQRAIVALHQGIESWARFLVAAGLLLWLGASSTVAMIGFAVAVVLVLGSQYVFFRRTVGRGSAAADTEKLAGGRCGSIPGQSLVFGTFLPGSSLHPIAGRWSFSRRRKRWVSTPRCFSWGITRCRWLRQWRCSSLPPFSISGRATQVTAGETPK